MDAAAGCTPSTFGVRIGSIQFLTTLSGAESARTRNESMPVALSRRPLDLPLPQDRSHHIGRSRCWPATPDLFAPCGVRNRGAHRRVVAPIIQRREPSMNWDRVEGNWKQFKGKVQQQWGKLTDDDLDVIEGKRTELAGRLQQRYGYAKDEAERNIDTWLNTTN
jgi:uncharacterized protein YjbJ (UPF0337 family)